MQATAAKLLNERPHKCAETLAYAYLSAEILALDDGAKCPCCDTIMNLDIWELPDGDGIMMEVCECGFVRFDNTRIVVTHDVQPPLF